MQSGKYDLENIFSFWLFNFVAHRCLRAVVKLKPQDAIDEDTFSVLSDEQYCSIDYVELMKARLVLSVAQRRVFDLHVIEGNSLAETAALLGIEEDDARQKFHRAREKMMKYLRSRGINGVL